MELRGGGAHRDMVARRQQRAGWEAVHAHRKAAFPLLQREATQVRGLLRRLVEDTHEPLPGTDCHNLQAGTPWAGGRCEEGRCTTQRGLATPPVRPSWRPPPARTPLGHPSPPGAP